MARQAAHKASIAPAQPTHTAKPENAATTRGPVAGFAAAFETLRRPGILVIASFAAFLLAGVWMVAGSGLRGMLPGGGTPAKTTSESAPDTSRPSERQDAAPREKQSSLPSRTTDTPRPAPSERTFPGMGRVVEGGVGIMVEEPRTPANPDTVAQVREQIHMANLSARVGQGHAAQQQRQDAPVSTTLAVPEQIEDRAPPVRLPEAGMARSVEMPPAMIGPLSLRHAAAKGDATAQLEVASRFAEGRGVPQDFTQAATWYQRAATQGHANAQFRLGALYERGLGVSADLARARVWYIRAAEQGNVRAMHNLAVLSAGRPGVAPDYPTAVHWFSEAANRGLADSQYNLGILYESGLGVPSSSVEAYKWYALAARTGDKEAAKRRDAVSNKLDRNSLQAADALVIQWRAKPGEPIAR
jgi:localization factor PodJL